MNRSDCLSEKISTRTLGFLLLPVGLFLGVIGGIVLPVLGFFFALPLLVMSGALFFAPESKACRLLVDKVSRK